jgi:ABC-type lipoprotein export system ATPase subunit
MTSALTAKGLTRTIPVGGVPTCVLRPVDVSVERRSSLAVVGSSGSGKSTLLSILGLLTVPTEGELTIEGTDCLRLSDSGRADFRARHIGFVFQKYSLIAHLTVGQNLMLPGSYSSTRKENRDRARELLSLVDLGHRWDARPKHLSGGEQQRVAIARSLMMAPSVLLADEPTGALDRNTAGRVLEIMYRTVSTLSTSLVLVTHDESVAASADRRISLDQAS